jgi:xanthine dehydrogenase accessory factor
LHRTLDASNDALPLLPLAGPFRMQDFLEQLALAGSATPSSVLATLIATHGARPRLAGAKLLVRPDGTTAGSITLGGCVEGRVAEAAGEVVRDGSARLLRVDLAEEEALDLGMGCAATLELLVEPIGAAAPEPAREAAAVRDALGRGRRSAVVRNPEAAVARLIVLDDGTRQGTLGDEDLDARAVELARSAIARRRSVLEPAEGTHPRLFIDVHVAPRTLYVFGAGPVAPPLLRMARELAMRTVLIDGRVDRGNAATPEADDVRVGSPGTIAAQLTFDRDSAVVIVAHDYKQELPVLERIVTSDTAYVGMLGNRRRGRAVLDVLAERGVPADALARVRVPAGLDLGAETPAEIALAILAELLAGFGERGAQ